MNELKAGDELAIKPCYGGQLQIRKIDRITLSGRLVVGDLVMNPDLTIRGPASRDFMYVKIATDAHRQQVVEEAEKRELIRGIKVGLADMRLLANSRLQRILEIIHE